MKTIEMHNVVQMYTTEKNSTKKKVSPEFKVKLREMNLKKFVVLAICGPAGRGKSFICSLLVSFIEKENQIEDYPKSFIFEPSAFMISKTKDIFCYATALKIPQTEMGLIILDVQGNGSLPNITSEENRDGLNIEKNFFIAMSTASVVIYILENRFLTEDKLNINAYQDLFEKIKKCLNINYPGMILFRNRNINLKVTEKGKRDNDSGEERKTYINTFVEKASLNQEIANNMHATCFPSYTNPNVEEIINDKSTKESFDYLMSVIQKYPKYINKDTGLFMDTDDLLFQIENIIEQMNHIEGRNQLSFLENPYKEIVKMKMKGEYQNITSQLDRFFADIKRNVRNLTEMDIKRQINEEMAQSNLQIDIVYEKLFENYYKFYKTKLDNFVQYHTNQILYQNFQEGVFSSYKAKSEERQNLKKKIASFPLESTIEMLNLTNTNALIEQDIAFARGHLEKQLGKIPKFEKKLENQENELNKLKNILEAEEKRASYFRLFKQKIQKKNQINTNLHEEYKQSQENFSELKNAIEIKEYEEKRLSQKFKKINNLSEDDIISKEKEAEAEETLISHKLIEYDYKKKQLACLQKDFPEIKQEIDQLSTSLNLVIKTSMIPKSRELSSLQIEIKKLTDLLIGMTGSKTSEYQNSTTQVNSLQYEIGKYKKTVQDLETQIHKMNQDFSPFKDEYPESKFSKLNFEICEYERYMEDKNNISILQNIENFNKQIQKKKQKINKLQIKKDHAIEKKNFVDHREEEQLTQMREEKNKTTIELEKRRESDKLSNEISELKEIISSYEKKNAWTLSSELPRKLSEKKYNRITLETEFLKITDPVKCEIDKYNNKFSQILDESTQLKENFSKKSNNIRIVLDYLSKHVVFYNELGLRLKEQVDSTKKSQFVRQICGMCRFFFKNPARLKEMVNLISINEMKRYMGNSFSILLNFLKDCESPPMMQDLDRSELQISLKKFTSTNLAEKKYPKNVKLILCTPTVARNQCPPDYYDNIQEICQTPSYPNEKKVVKNDNMVTCCMRKEPVNEYIPDDNENSEEIDTNPYSSELFREISQELFSSFSSKNISVVSSNGQMTSSLEDYLVFILEILKNPDENEIAQELKKLEIQSIESPMKILCESIKSKSRILLSRLKEYPKFNKLLTTLYLHTDAIFQANFNNLCLKLFELPLIFEYNVGRKSQIFVNKEIVNTSQACTNIGFLPYLEINSDSFFEEKTKYVNNLFSTQFISKNKNLNAQIKMMDIKGNDNFLFSLFLLNQNYVIHNLTELTPYIKFLDVLFLFIEPTHYEEIPDFVLKKLLPMKNKLFVIIPTTDIGSNLRNELLLKDLSEKIPVDGNVIIILEYELLLNNLMQQKISTFIQSNYQTYKDQFNIRKEIMVNFLAKLGETNFFSEDNPKDIRKFTKKINTDNSNPLIEIFTYLNNSVRAFTQKKNTIEECRPRLEFQVSDKIFTSGIFFNEYFNLKFLKQNFYLKNILQCELLRSAVETSPEDREEYNKLIHYLQESRSQDLIGNNDIVEFFTWMSRKDNGNFITKYSLFTNLLKNAFLSNKDIIMIKDHFSFEHILREISYSKCPQNQQSYLNIVNAIFMDLTTNYQPFEIIDGDSLSFSLENQNLLLGKFSGNIFVVSIVGPQSSGKSTILNNLFSVGFQTSQGRCSRGIYGSLLPVKDNPNFSYILVLDTEGIDSAENKFDKMLTRRLMLFLLKVSHLVLLSPGQELKSSFAGEFLLACNNYINIHCQNAVIKPTIYCLFNNVGVYREGEESKVFSTWNEILKEKLYYDSDNYQEIPIEDVFLFEEPAAIPNYFFSNNFNLINNYHYFSYEESFIRAIANIKQVIRNKLNDTNVQAVKFDNWLNLSKMIWNDISQMKNLTAIEGKNDIASKKILNDILEDCKKQIKEILTTIEEDVKDFKNTRLTESEKCNLGTLIKKMNDFSSNQSQQGKGKIMSSFENAVRRKFPEKCPERLKRDKVVQIENIFKIIELEYQLLSFREIQQELKHILYIGKSDFHKCLKMEARRIKQELKTPMNEDIETYFKEYFQKKKDIETYFEEYFQKNAYQLLTSLDSFAIDQYFNDVFFYIFLKADSSIDFFPYEHCFYKFKDAFQISEEIINIYSLNQIHMFLPKLKDKINIDTFYQKSKQKDLNPYVTILPIIKISETIQIFPKLILDHIKYDKIENEILALLRRNEEYIINMDGHGVEPIPNVNEAVQRLCAKLDTELSKFGFQLDMGFSNFLTSTIYKYLGFEVLDKIMPIIRDNIIGNLGQFVKFIKKQVYLAEVTLLNFEYIDPNIKNIIQNKAFLYKIDDDFMSYNLAGIDYERGLKNYFYHLMSNQNLFDYEIIKYSNMLLQNPEILNLKKLFDDIDNQLLNIFQLSTISSKLEDFFSFFNIINRKPFEKKSIELLLKFENEINRTANLDNATLSLIFGEIDKIIYTVREGMEIYGFDITDYFKFYVYAYVIGRVAFISHSNYKLKFLVMLNEFHRRKEDFKKEFLCIIYNDYEELTKIAADNIFKKFISLCVSDCMDICIEKYKSEMSQEAAKLTNINKQKEAIEKKIADIDINILNLNSLDPADKEFYFNILVNPDEIYRKEFDCIWNDLDTKVKDDCAKIYSKRLENYIHLFDILFQDAKNDFTTGVFQQELNEMFTVSQSGSADFNDYASKGLFIIFKSYLTNYPLTNEFQINAEPNITIRFNNMLPRTPNKYITFPTELHQILKNTFVTDENIHSMLTFINSLETHLLLYKNEGTQNDKTNLDMGELKNVFKQKFIECTSSCPFCHRKCEESHQNNAKIVHRCSLHQYRIIAGIKLDSDFPSFFLCDNVKNESVITMNGVKKTWFDITREIKEKYGWEFGYIEDQEKRKIFNDLLLKIWKLFGNDICNYYNSIKNLKVKYLTYEEYNNFRLKTHYIFMLDYSGSMKGYEWQCVQNAFKDIMIKIKNNNTLNDSSAISVGIFNHKMTVQAKLSQADENLLNNSAEPNGGTNYEEAFDGIYQLTHEEMNNYNEIRVLFMTDGLAEYPHKAIEKIMNDDYIIAKTSFHINYFSENKACPALLKQIEEELAKKAKFAKIDVVYEAAEVTKTFNEVINLRYD